MWGYRDVWVVFEQEEFELAYQAAKAAGVEPDGIQDAADDPSRLSVQRWVMNNAHCGWLIGKGGSGIQNIEVRGSFVRELNGYCGRAEANI